MKMELERVINNTKVKFINVPIPNEYIGTLSKDTVNKLNEFEKLIKRDLGLNKCSVTVDFEKPYNATGYLWIPPEKDSEKNMKKIIEGKLECFDSGGYEGSVLKINDSLLDNELVDFDNKKVRIIIEEIK